MRLTEIAALGKNGSVFAQSHHQVIIFCNDANKIGHVSDFIEGFRNERWGPHLSAGAKSLIRRAAREGRYARLVYTRMGGRASSLDLTNTTEPWWPSNQRDTIKFLAGE